MHIKRKNLELESMMISLQPILPHRDKVGYVAARNTRILRDALTEFLAFKTELVHKYGEENHKTRTISILRENPNFDKFQEEFSKYADIEQEVDIMTIKYEEVIGLLNGEEILALEWMLED